MELKKITTPEDIEIVRSFFYDIFYEESEYDLIHIKDSITGKFDFKRLEYYFGYENDTVVGMSGVYANNTNECWLGWFGVIPEHRRKGYASVILDLQLEIMKKYGYKVCRLYTDVVINEVAVQLYIKNGFKKDSDYKDNIIVMSKQLEDGVSISKWRGIPLGFVPES